MLYIWIVSRGLIRSTQELISKARAYGIWGNILIRINNKMKAKNRNTQNLLCLVGCNLQGRMGIDALVPISTSYISSLERGAHVIFPNLLMIQN